MAAVLFALVSASAYGLSDFLGGLLSRKGSAWPVAVAGQVSTALCTSAVALFAGGHPSSGHFAWAVLAGVGTAVGTGFLYRGLASGRMGVVAPISAVGTALVPVVVGIATGDQLSWIVYLGVAAALPGIWLVSTAATSTDSTPRGPRPDLATPPTPRLRRGPPTDAHAPSTRAAGLRDGGAAGLGFGVLLVALGQVPSGAGLWPLAACQATSVPVLIAIAVGLRAAWRPGDRASRLALLTGPIGTLATGAFLLAAQHGYLAVAGIITSLYPASTILLATAILHERIQLLQAIGLGLCGIAVACVAAG